MYIVNTSFIVEPQVHDRWFEFLTLKVIPQITAQEFQILAFTRVLNDSPQPHHTYSLQVVADDIPQYQRFMSEIIGDYASIAKKLFAESALHITTLLKKIPLTDA